MNTVKIRSCFPQDVTVISNDFLDRFLPAANGEFMKIYLYLLRTAGKGEETFSICSIADRMNCTENDVLRALRYWEKEGVLQMAEEKEEIRFTSFGRAGMEGEKAAPDEADSEEIGKSSDISTERMTELGEMEDIRELFFIAQQYLGKPLTRTEMQKLCFFYDRLHFSPDLIDYLIDYCVTRGHTSFHYIEKVALGWKEQGIRSVHEARKAAGSYHREYYDILKALGINNHHPVDAETKYMKKWIEKYEFPMEIIEEACTRTVMNASKPTLGYVDGILSRWYAKGVSSMEDVARLDEQHIKMSASVRGAAPAKEKSGRTFNNFDQRDLDYSALEASLLKSGV